MSTAAPLQITATNSKPVSDLPHPGLLLQRKCASVLQKSSLSGECEECKGMKRLQGKFTIGVSNDPLEQEADRVADQVLALPSYPSVSAVAGRIQRFTGESTGPADTALASVDRVLASSGSPLEPALQQDMEQRFGHNFSRVRVHSGAAAEQSARAVSANAYTVGHHIVFDSDRFAPGTHEGRRLIAHELTHVVQQSGAAEGSGVANAGLGFKGRFPIHSARPMLARQNSTRNPGGMTDRELQSEYERVRRWLLQHNMVETDYFPSQKYFEALEAEVFRRKASAAEVPAGRPAGTSGPPDVHVPPGSSRVSVSPQGTLFSGPRAREAPVTASYAGGALGEKELPFALGEQGMHMVITASGPGAHPLTGHGFDAIAWDPKQRELWLIDNKSTGDLGRLEGGKATALGPNLESSLADAVDKVRKIQDFPDKAEIVGKLEKSLASVRAGKGIPQGIGVKLKLTNAGGYGGGKGVGARNLPPQTTAEDLVSPAVRKARGEDVAAAKINEAGTSRPRSHADTEAARVKVGGAQSREPIVRSKVGIIGGTGALLGLGILAAYFRGKLDESVIQNQMKGIELDTMKQIESKRNEVVLIESSNAQAYANVTITITSTSTPSETSALPLRDQIYDLPVVTLDSLIISNKDIDEPPKMRKERHFGYNVEYRTHTYSFAVFVP